MALGQQEEVELVEEKHPFLVVRRVHRGDEQRPEMGRAEMPRGQRTRPFDCVPHELSRLRVVRVDGAEGGEEVQFCGRVDQVGRVVQDVGVGEVVFGVGG